MLISVISFDNGCLQPVVKTYIMTLSQLLSFQEMNTKKEHYLLLTIFTVCLVVPFSIDIFISGLPDIGQHFPGSNVSLLLSIALLGFAVAQPIYGPLLDRFGRRPVLLGGLWLYTLASALICACNLFGVLLLGRLLQAMGACSATIAVFAIARDCYSDEKLVRVMSLIMALMGISPALAPLLGSLLNAAWGWRASFIFLLILGIVYTTLVQIFLNETFTKEPGKIISLRHMIATYLDLLGQAKFLPYCFISGVSYSILFSYFNLAPLFIIQQMGLGVINFGIIVALNALAIIAMAFVMPSLAKKLVVIAIMRMGLGLILMGGSLMWFLTKHYGPTLATFMLTMFLTTLGIGMIRALASASAMSLVPKQVAGSAAAMFNFIAFMSGMIATSLTSRWVFQVSEFGVFIILMGSLGIFVSLFQFVAKCLPANKK